MQLYERTSRGKQESAVYNAPKMGSFQFYYRGILIRVPALLNDIARTSSDSFWDSLISKYSNSMYIPLSHEDVKELS